MSSGERPIGTAKGNNQTNTMASCQPSPPPPTVTEHSHELYTAEQCGAPLRYAMQ